MVLNSNTVTVIVTAPAPVATTLTLTESASNIQTGQNDTFTATVTDQNGNAMSGVSVSFFDATTDTQFSKGTTNSSGQASATATFNTAGTYGIYAQVA